MEIVDADRVSAEPPAYDRNNPLLAACALVEGTRLAAGREFYPPDDVHHLFPFERLELYGPTEPRGPTDPRQQDAKEDFQKQNVRSVVYGDTRMTRGWAVGDGWAVPFLRLTYRAGPDTRLSELAGHALGERVSVRVRVGDRAAEPIPAPYHPESHRYSVELWGDPGTDVRRMVDGRGLAAVERGELVVRPDLVRGCRDAFARERVEGASVWGIDPECTTHPVRPLSVVLSWGDAASRVWDDNDGRGYRYRFGMAVRGWDQFLKAGRSDHPHGGPGSMEYRDLFTNYFGGAALGELGHDLRPWQFDAGGKKGRAGREAFVAVNYANLSLVRPGGGVGLHRHRDGSEFFFVARGRGVMATGDWCRFPGRDRALELRPVRDGSLVLVHGGHLHGLLNVADDDLALLSFGGYD